MKLDVCKVFGPESILDKDLFETKDKNPRRKSLEQLQKNIQKFVENVVQDNYRLYRYIRLGNRNEYRLSPAFLRGIWFQDNFST